MTENAFTRMAGRLAYGAQSLGTGIGSGYSSNASQGADIINGLKVATRGAGTAATLRTLKGQTLGLMESVKSWGLLKTLGYVGLGLTAFEFGYEIGGKIADLFFGGGGDGEEEPEGISYVFPDAVTIIGAEENLPFPVGACEADCVSEAAEGVIIWNGTVGAGTLYNPLEEPCPPYGMEGVEYLNMPSNGQIHILQNYHQGCTPGVFGIKKKGVVTVPIEVSHLPGEEGGEPKETRKGSAPEPRDSAGSQLKAKECLETFAICGLLGPWWWNHDPEAKEDTHIEARGRFGLDPADPLSVHIPPPGIGMRYTEYDEELEELELVPEPAVLAESAISSEVGPEGVVSTNPHIGASVELGAHVKVRYNPSDAAESDEENGTETGQPPWEPGGWVPPALPAIDLSPLSNLGEACSVFPFGVLCWVGSTLTSWSGEGTCPKVGIPVGKTIGQEYEIGIDTCQWEPAMEIIRPVLVVLCTIGLGMLFAGWALGGNSGGSADG